MEDIFFEGDEDELEYHITFPSPTEKSDGSHEPVIFLFGWGGSQCSQSLFELGVEYNNAGCITIVYIPPRKYNYLDSSEMRPIASKLLDLMEEMALEKNPILIHSFSKLGGSLYQCFVEAMHKDPMKKYRLKGRIFDSNPSRSSFISFIRDTQRILESDPLISGAISYLMPFILLFYRMMYVLRANIKYFLFGGPPRMPSTFDWMCRNEDHPGAPYLFLFSKEDKIAHFKDIQAVIDAKKGMGCNVDQICYELSAHIEHFKRNRESYVASLIRFVHACCNE